MHFSKTERLIFLTLNKRTQMIPDVWIVRFFIEVYRNICTMGKCK